MGTKKADFDGQRIRTALRFDAANIGLFLIVQEKSGKFCAESGKKRGGNGKSRSHRKERQCARHFAISINRTPRACCMRAMVLHVKL